jgi:hypothetical protein
VIATAIVRNRRVDSWNGNVWVDKPPGNEDPFVLAQPWLYSYCHATQLRREPNPAGYVTGGSCLVFCSGDLADQHRVLAVDTIFWVAKAHRWGREDIPPQAYEQHVSNRSDLWRYHFRFGGVRGGHNGRYTYEAAVYPQPLRQYSRLPLDANGGRVQVAIGELSHDLRSRIQNCLHGKRPALPSHAHLDEVLRSVADQTVVEVVGDIVPNDRDFTRLRQQDGHRCGTCQPRPATAGCS